MGPGPARREPLDSRAQRVLHEGGASRAHRVQVGWASAPRLVWVEDVAEAISLALGPAGESTGPFAWNVGGENSRSIYSLATLVCERAQKILGWSPRIERPEPAEGDREIPVQSSIARLRAAGYEPHDWLLEETDRLIGMLTSRTDVA